MLREILREAPHLNNQKIAREFCLVNREFFQCLLNTLIPPRAKVGCQQPPGPAS